MSATDSRVLLLYAEDNIAVAAVELAAGATLIVGGTSELPQQVASELPQGQTTFSALVCK